MDVDAILAALLAASPERSLASARERYAAAAERAGMTLPEPGDGTAVRMEKDGDGTVTLRVSGPFDSFWGLDVRGLIKDLDEAEPKAIHMLVESPGGIVADGLALYADLTRRKAKGVKVTAQVVGLAASAATLPLMAAEKDGRTAVEGSLVMIHNAWTMAFIAGDKSDFEAATKKVLNALGAIDATVAGIVSKATGMTLKAAKAALDAETWYDAEAAVEAGIVARIDDAAPDKEPDDEARAMARAALASFAARAGVRK